MAGLKAKLSIYIWCFSQLAFVNVTQAKSDQLCQGLVNDQLPRSVTPANKPAYLKPWRDPDFGGVITRISNDGYGSVVKPSYSTTQAWNADESLLMLYHTGGHNPGHYLYDGSHYQRLGRLDIQPVDLEEVFWDTENPHWLYYVARKGEHKGWLIRANVSTGTKQKLINSQTLCGQSGLMTTGHGTMMQAVDQPLITFRCQLKQNDLAYQINLKTLKVSPPLAIGGDSRWSGGHVPNMAHSGQRAWHDNWVLSPDLQRPLRQIDIANSQEHASIGKNHLNQDTYFQVAFNKSPKGCDGDASKGIGSLVAHNLETGECQNLLPRQQWGYPLSGIHVSATAYQSAGWVGVSVIGYNHLKYLKNHKTPPLLFSEILLVNTKHNGGFCRIARSRSHGKAAKNGGYAPYFGEPHATLSPSGSRIVFGSDWGDSGQVDAYVIELPIHSSRN